jgi:hypothetical protein
MIVVHFVPILQTRCEFEGMLMQPNGPRPECVKEKEDALKWVRAEGLDADSVEKVCKKIFLETFKMNFYISLYFRLVNGPHTSEILVKSLFYQVD